MLICPYCDGEVIEPPAEAGKEKPYVCISCFRHLAEKELIVDNFRVGTTVL